MKGDRFFSLAYDARHHPKIELLRDAGGGIAAFGRWVALISILYDSDGMYDYSKPLKRRLLCRELELDDGELDGFLELCADCDLISPSTLAMEHVTSNGVCEQLDYKRKKSEAGKKGMKARWNGKQAANSTC